MPNQEGELGGVQPRHQQVPQTVSAAAAATITGGTVDTSVGVARVSPAGAITGVIFAVGTRDGQSLTVVNEAIAANTVTPAAAGTSHIADGVTGVLVGLTAQDYVWDASTSLWYHRV